MLREGAPMQRKARVGGLTRRQFVAAGAAGSVAAAVGCKALMQRGDGEFLSDAQAATLGALCDQIVPADDYPSATQAGVLTYIDRQLVRHFRRYQHAYAQGLKQAEDLCRKRFGRGLVQATPGEQFQVASALEQQAPEFFDLVRNHTLQGYYGAPRHGGNRDAVSWRMLGLDVPPLRGRAQYDLRKGPQS